MLVVPQGGITALLTPERGGKQMESIPLPDFRQQLPGLSRDERNLILDQARIVLGQNYVHLTDKRRLTLVDPVAACELLRAKVATWGSSAEAELMFHEELLGVFHGIRDRHTRYLLPAPLADATAFLPFTVDIANDQGAEVAIVTELLPELDGRRNFLARDPGHALERGQHRPTLGSWRRRHRGGARRHHPAGGQFDVLPAVNGGDSGAAHAAASRMVPASSPTAALAGGLTPVHRQ
jgi:hypothetical protein